MPSRNMIVVTTKDGTRQEIYCKDILTVTQAAADEVVINVREKDGHARYITQATYNEVVHQIKQARAYPPV